MKLFNLFFADKKQKFKTIEQFFCSNELFDLLFEWFKWSQPKGEQPARLFCLSGHLIDLVLHCARFF